MAKYLLRIEAVNFSAVIDDTDDLSTRRGGGLMALYAVRQLNKILVPKELRSRLQLVATGASIGLFTFDAENPDEAESVAEAVREHFRDGTLESSLIDEKTTLHVPLRHASFVVDVVAVEDSPAQAVARATTANRWRQWQQPTVPLGGLWDTEGAARECWQSRARPATPGLKLPKDQDHEVCQSVHDRHDYGRNQRQRFYLDVHKSLNFKFSDSFKELSQNATQPMAGKLAVFYTDGNGFGDITRAKLAEGFDEYSAWSRALQAHHDALLHRLLDRAAADQDWKIGDSAIRLETLLWGGDEIIWVVPGWKGWELVEWFFSQEHKALEKELTYAAGLVFCGYNTPIHNVVHLAKRLGEAAKEVAKGADSPIHGLAYEVLESFDDITGDLDAHRRRYLPAGRPVGDLVINPKQPPEAWNALRAIAASRDFPTRQLYMLTKAWRRGEDVTVDNQPNRKRLMAADVEKELKVFLKAFGGDVGWLHLLEMLPYLPVPAEEKTSERAGAEASAEDVKA